MMLTYRKHLDFESAPFFNNPQFLEPGVRALILNFLHLQIYPTNMADARFF